MFPYRVQYTESEYDIQNRPIHAKLHSICWKTFEKFETFQQSQTIIPLYLEIT